MVNLVLLGAPGSGKGVQADIILKSLKLAHVSTGNILRKELSEGSDIGLEAKSYMEKGLLVPEEVIIRIVEKELASDRCANGFVLDGVPRTIFQAEMLDKIMVKLGKTLDMAISLDVTEETLVKRLTNRRTCVNCGRVFNLIGQPPKVAGQCDDCQRELIQRADDNEETVRKRFVEYELKTKPLLNFYQNKGILFTLNGELDKQFVFEQIRAELAKTGK